MRCIYCKRILVEEATDGTQPSKEHIVQWAVGGSNELVTHDVCKSCNSKLGETVDADFINQEIIGFQRLMYDVKGHGGTVPPVKLSGEATESGYRGTVVFTKETVEPRHIPNVTRSVDQSGRETVSVSGLRKDAEKIAEGLLRKAQKNGQQILAEDGHPAQSIEDLCRGAASQKLSRYSAQMKVDLIALARGNAKIAFGFAHAVLGSSWSFSASAEPLRAVATGQGSIADVEQVVKASKPGIRGFFVLNEPDEPRTHVVGLLPSADGKVVVSLFGGAFSYCCDVGHLNPTLLETAMMSPSGIAVEIDPIDRSLRRVVFLEVFRNIRDGAFMDGPGDLVTNKGCPEA